MSETLQPCAVLRALLYDDAAGWSIGVPAAVAEFMRASGEPCNFSKEGDGVTTGRGAIRLTWHEDARLLAYEAPSRRPERWLQGLVACLSEDTAAMGERNCLTALGPDHDAIGPTDCDVLLFDLGAGAPQVDFCVRSADADLVALLNAHCGRALADWPPEVMAALMAANPPRVVISRLGRIEVTGPIPSERTPLEPHTHLFPDKLGEGLIHDPAVPVPTGWLPCLQVYPAHPQFDLAGDPIPFDPDRHDAFQALLQAFGEPGYLAAKAGAVASLSACGEVDSGKGIDERALEVARRQWNARPAGSD